MRVQKRNLLGPALLTAVVGVLAWGQFEPRATGFTPTASEGSIASSDGGVPVAYTVDARSTEAWVFFDFARSAVIDTSFEAGGWDIALRRTQLRTNGGITNRRGNVAVANLGAVAFDLTAIPERPVFATDRLGGDDGDEVVNNAIPKWYRYNFISHAVSARDAVYDVRTDRGRDALVRFESYYCEDGSPGCVTVRYLLVPHATAESR